MMFSPLHQAYTVFKSKFHALFKTDADPHIFRGFLFNDFTTPLLFSPNPMAPWFDAVSMRPVLQENEAFVYKIKFCKRRARPGHEFLICYVREAQASCTPPGGHQRESVVLIERNADGAVSQAWNADQDDYSDVIRDSAAQTSTEQRGTPVPPHPASGRASDTHLPRKSKDFPRLASRAVSSDSAKVERTGDVIAFSNTGTDAFVEKLKRRYYTCTALSLPDETFTLPRLIALCIAVHKMHPTYTADVFNCHWLAFAIYNSIHEMFPEGTEVEGQETFKSRGKLLGIVRSGRSKYRTSKYIEKFESEWPAADGKIKEVRALADAPLRATEELQETIQARDETIRARGETIRALDETILAQQETIRDAQAFSHTMLELFFPESSTAPVSGSHQN